MRFVCWVLLVGCSAGYGGAARGASGLSWELTGERLEEANSAEEFRIFQARYPEYFGEEDAARVGYAFVRTERYQYRGSSSCPAGDPRLMRELVTHGACLGLLNEGECFQAMSGGFPRGDPCLKAAR